jgi:ABC-type lipoprotein export system ATPase subunit
MKIDPQYLTEDDITFMLTPRLNAASRMDSPQHAFDVLAESDPVKAATVADHLIKINDLRKTTVATIMKDVHKKLEKRELKDVIVIGHPEWRVGVLGLVASKITETYNRPSFVWGSEGAEDKTLIKGSCRSEGSVNVVELMTHATEAFHSFGGHELAGGFVVTHEQVHFLEDALTQAFPKVQREKEILDLQTSASSLEALIDELDQKLNEDFKIGMDKINSQFTNFFALMFGGGFASLSIVKKVQNKKNLLENLPDEGGEILEEKEEEQGIDIDVSLPRKKVKGLIQLSGGERALTSIALLFAMSQVNPPPFIILDETDAALDEANSRKYGDMIENLSKFSQLIVITHNRETMSRAGSLYGITMGSGGVSKLLSVSFEDAVVVAK